MNKELKDIYLAGLFDGEGCIIIRSNIQKYKSKITGSTRKHKTYSLLIAIGNTDKRMITWLKQNYGGYVQKIIYALYPNSKPQWKWQVVCKKAYNILKLIQPYSICKNKRIKLAIKYMDKTTGKGHNKLREILKRQMNALNKRGIN